MEASDYTSEPSPQTSIEVEDATEQAVEATRPDPAEVVKTAGESESNPVDSVVATLNALESVQVATAGGPGADLPPVKFDRLSVERRVLGHVTDEVDTTALGPRNTLAALTYALVRDRNTTHAAGGNPRFEVDGMSVAESAQAVLDYLDDLKDAGLLVQRDDGSYEVTEDGLTELRN